MIETIARKLNFPDEAIKVLSERERKMIEACAEKLYEAEKSMFIPDDFGFMPLLAEIAESKRRYYYFVPHPVRWAVAFG